jgi:uncharacterized protein (TIGR02266 family)
VDSQIKRILVADDNEAVRVMLEDILSEAGYKVETAVDGMVTFNQLQKEEYDLVILDLLMPQKSGFEILEWLTQRKGRPMVLVLTGIFKSPREIDRLRQLGAKGYIYKSAPVEEILFRVNRVLFPVDRDTRKHPRIPVNIPVEYRLNAHWHQAYSSTLSAEGLFIRTINPIECGTAISVKFTLPEMEHVVQATGTVVWCNEYQSDSRKTSLPGMGVRFHEIGEEDRKALIEFIEDQLSKEMMW